MLALGETYLEDICFPYMDRYGEQVNTDGSYIYIFLIICSSLPLNYLAVLFNI